MHLQAGYFGLKEAAGQLAHLNPSSLSMLPAVPAAPRHVSCQDLRTASSQQVTLLHTHCPALKARQGRWPHQL